MAIGSYAVRWWNPGETPRVGKLEMQDAVARLSARGVEPLVLDRGDVIGATIARSATEAADGRPTFVIQRWNDEPIFVQSVLGFGLLHELAESLAPVHAGAPVA
jgi:hypothetical protein